MCRKRAFAVLLALAGPAMATDPELAAEQLAIDSTSNTYVGGPTEQRFVQVFELYDTGPVSHVMLPLGCQPQARVMVSIEQTTAGLPNGNVLVRKVLPGYALDAHPTASGAVGMRLVEFARSVSLNPGTYALTVSMDSSKYVCVIWYGPAGNSYPYGDAHFMANYNPPGWQPLGRDLAFQVFQRPL